MADLSPNLSPYAALAKSSQSGIGSLGPGQLLNLIQSSRELQTQSAASDALRASNGDPNAALQSLMRPGAPGFMSPELISHMATASQAVTSAKMDQLRKTADFVAYHADDPDLDDAKIHQLVTTAVAGGGVPPEQGQAFLSTLPAPTGNKAADQKALKTALVNWQSTLTGGQPPAMGALPGRGGEPVPVSPSEAALMGRGLMPTPGAQSEVLTGPTGRPMTSIPGGTQKTITAAGDMASELLAGGPRRNSMNAMLNTLEQLGKSTEISGPTADIEKRIKQAWQRVFPGDENSPAAQDVASAEGYAKITNNITSQMATASHPTDAFLHNAYGANPQLDLTKLGRTGMTHYLQGINDAEARVATEWSNWSAQHPGQEGRHISWLYGHEPGSTIDVNQFDPRVFQYARMSPAERKEFRAQMTPAQRDTLNQHAQDYYKRGWVNFGGQ